MKYYESKRPKKGRQSIVIAVACCLLAGGAVLWNLTAKKISGRVTPEVTPPDTSSYYMPDPSYNNSGDLPDPASDVTNPISDVPYTSEPEESEPESTDEPTPSKPTLPVEGKISKHFDAKALQYSATFGDLRLHTGIDIAAKAGATVITAGEGTVTATDESAVWGKTVTVDHGDGLIFKYCGLDQIQVATGDRVIAGQTLGVVGNIPGECAEPSHLHLEATLNGVAVSPEDLF